MSGRLYDLNDYDEESMIKVRSYIINQIHGLILGTIEERVDEILDRFRKIKFTSDDSIAITLPIELSTGAVLSALGHCGEIKAEQIEETKEEDKKEKLRLIR